MCDSGEFHLDLFGKRSSVEHPAHGFSQWQNGVESLARNGRSCLCPVNLANRCVPIRQDPT